MDQVEHFGAGSMTRIGDVLAELGAGRVMLVAGKNSYAASGVEAKIAVVLDRYKVRRFSEFSPNPQVADIRAAAEIVSEFRPDVILAVGGGSPMDVAKAAMIFAANDITYEEWFSDSRPVAEKRIPIIAVPTTAGSGSEATQFAVFYDGKTKKSFAEPKVVPDVIIVDPELMMSLPQYQAASGGMDALAQAIESYWSVHSTSESKEYAAHAIEIAIADIVESVTDPSPDTRFAMAKAANLAGKAINITRTTACHAVAYPFTSYFGVAHGHAVALTLGAMFEYIAGVTDEDLLDERGCEYVLRAVREISSLLGCEKIENVPQLIEKVMTEIGLKTRLRDLGLSGPEDIETIVANGFAPDRVKNIPRLLTEDALRGMLEGLY